MVKALKKLLLTKEKLLIGWKEWCALPKLHIHGIKAKIDTGAKTSALHAVNIREVKRRDGVHVKFQVHPLQHRDDVVVNCEAKVTDRRYVMNSGGHREYRYIIQTTLILGEQKKEIELTLTNRDLLTYRMLIGREALKGGIVINPSRGHCTGKIPEALILKKYRLENKR